MNIKDLAYIVAVAELKSFKKAADRCFVTQPTLSTQLGKLEAVLGVKLFERNNKQVLITETGQKIVDSAHRILAEVDTIKSIAEVAKNPLAGTFKIGAFSTIAGAIFPPMVPKLSHAFPKLKLVFVENKTDALLEQLENGQLDAAILSLPVGRDSLESIELFNDDFYLAVSSAHPLSNRKKMEVSELSGIKMLLLEDGHCLRDQSLDICSASGSEPDQDLRATGIETLRQMVRANTGVTLMPESAIKKEKDITYIRLINPVPKRKIGLAWRKISARKELFRQVGRHIKMPLY